ncbi:hypothetical protein MYCTH_2306852 [Thermothelomyces thermophilus ATCC 42464]|uniref:Uncharacterized protein n=1 Tax=Thermothelomyces thermophilus (strain ATCC 42464 / BCRC 31852 / DSM 1799) TaxID=573729 RepID=G2QEX1_THET4|nr:uncharacterized protein MYCTH_2306852 [Thermothelomyces thermophilus ATCC 42464]AEO59000.1 hypothetical protein MYCTH_2306852 [Thermothelomyces thermophilus ATCC 42464]
MALRIRGLSQRALASRPICLQLTSSARAFTLSARLAASRRAIQRQQAITLRVQRPPQPGPQTPPSSPQRSSRDEPKAESLATLVNQRRWPLFFIGLMALGMSFYISVVITTALKDDGDDKVPLPPSPSPSPSSSSSPSSSCCYDAHLPAPTGLPSTLDTSNPAAAAASARDFDRSLNTPEWLMGITKLRRALALRARGHVLEVAVGTGRNLAHYDWSEVASLSQDEPEARAARERERVVRLLDRHRLGGPTLREQRERERAGELGSLDGEVLSYTGVDVSADMMSVARDRIREAVPGLSRLMRRRRLEEMPRLDASAGVGDEGVPVVEALDGRVRLVLGDAVRGLPPPPNPPAGGRGTAPAAVPPAKYDTIIQTFGLCSVADPARLLANMAAKLQPDTGRIILLEHGRGVYDWINRRLDKSAPKHFRKFGCWWNRDIEKLVRDAAETIPGLEIVELDRPLWFQWGTTLLIELRLNSQGGNGAGQKA